MGAALGPQASQAKNRMAGSEGFMGWLRGRHEAYTDMWHNAMVGLGNRGQMLVDDRLPRQQVADIVTQRIVADPTINAESALGQALRRRLEKLGGEASEIQKVENHLYGGKESADDIRAGIHSMAADKEWTTNEDIMDLYEAAQNAGARRIPIGDQSSFFNVASTALKGPQAAYLVPLTGAGLALLGGYAATRPNEDERAAQPAQR